MNFSPLRGFSPYNSSSTKSTFPLQEESIPSSSSLGSFSSDIISSHTSISNTNQTYNIRKLKHLVTSCKISQSPLYDKVLLTLDCISTDLNDSSLLDFCEFVSCCYKTIPQEVIPRIVSIFQTHQFSANFLIIISYLIKDFQDNPYDENSKLFFQRFINNSFVQLLKELLSSTINSPNNNISDNFLTNNSFHNLEKLSNCFQLCIVDPQNLDTYFNEEDDFEITNVDDNYNHSYNNVIIYENNLNNNNNINNDNSNSRLAPNNSQNDSLISSRETNNGNENTNNDNSNHQKIYKLFNCTFSHEQILKFLLYFLRSKEMRETNPMCNSWIDFAQILVSQYENQAELAQFANYMISIGKINMVPKEMFMNINFINIADKNSVIEVLKILSADDISKNELLLAILLNHFRDSEVATAFMKKCQELDYTLSHSFLKEISNTSGKLISKENEHYKSDLTEIINRINPDEFNESFLTYLSRYTFKINLQFSTKILNLYLCNDQTPRYIFEFLITIIDSPLKIIDYRYLIPYLYTCTNIDVFNSITNNNSQSQNCEKIIHPIFKDPKFWSQLISLFEFNSIQHFSQIFISNNSDYNCGSLVANIFLDQFPKNMKRSFYCFAKNVLKGYQDSFSTCQETRELLSRIDHFYPTQFWRIFTKTNLLIDLARSNQGKPFYSHIVLSLSLVQIYLSEENNMCPQDPLIKNLYLPTPLTSNLFEEIVNFFTNNDDYFKIEGSSEEAIQIFSVGHYYYSALVFHYAPFNIAGFNPLYCMVLFIIIIHDMKKFRNMLFTQLKKILNALMNTQKNATFIRQAFEIDFNGKDQLIDIFLSEFGPSDDDNYVLCINDNDLKWVRFVFDNDSLLATNLAYSSSLSYFFGQLTLCVNAFNCPLTNKFILSKINYLLQLFYAYPCPFFTLNNEILENFIHKKIISEGMSFRAINFIMSSVTRLSQNFVFPEFDILSIASPFIKQNKTSDISVIFDFCHLYMLPAKSVNLIKAPNLPMVSKVSYNWIFNYLSNSDFRHIFSIDCIKNLVHTTDFSFINAIIRAVEGILDDDETVSNRCTYVAQMKKRVFSLGENFLFPSRLALNSIKFNQNSYNPNFLYGLYRVYEDSFVDYNNHVLIERVDFIPLNPNSEFSIDLLNELIKDAIQTNSWQMFYVLKSIANTHLFLFTNNEDKDSFDLIEIFKYCVNSITSLNYHNLNDTFKLFIACHSFLSFLLLSPCIADAFFNWVLSQFEEFNSNEVYYILTIISNYLNDPITEKQMLVFCIKYNLVTLIIKHLRKLSAKKEDISPDSSSKSNDDPGMAIQSSSSTTTNTNTPNSSQSQGETRTISDNIFNEQILYIDYDLFSDTENENESDDNVESYLSAIQLETNSNERERSNSSNYQTASSSINSKSIRNDETVDLNKQGIIKCTENIKKHTWPFTLSLISVIEMNISTLCQKTNYLKMIEIDEMLKNASPNPIYKGSYNDCLNFSEFKPFSYSFPRNIAIPNLTPRSFASNLSYLRSSLTNIDCVKNFTQSHLIGEIDSSEITIQINLLKNPYERGPINFDCPIDFNNETNNNINNNNLYYNGPYHQQWTGNINAHRTPLLKDIISINHEEYDFIDEGGQISQLRQQLPPLINVSNPYIHRFLMRLPSWSTDILSNSPVRAILPPRHLIELHRINYLIKNLKPNSNTKQNSRNNDYQSEINTNKFIFDLHTKDGLVETKIDFVANVLKERLYLPVKSIQKICQIFFSNASKSSEDIVKKVFSIGNKYLSFNSDMSAVIGILCAFESMKKCQFFAANFSTLSALNVYESFGRSCILNADIAVLACSLFSAIGSSIPNYGIQVFETCLEINDPKVYDCLEYIAQLPEKVKQQLTTYVCNLIDNRTLLISLDESLTESNNDENNNNNNNNNDSQKDKNSKEENKNQNNENKEKNKSVSLIEQVVKNFPKIVKMRSNKFIEILSCILEKGKYLSVVGMIAGILCPSKASNKLKSSSSSSSNASATPSSSAPSLTSITESAPQREIITTTPAARRTENIQQQQQQQQQQQNDQNDQKISILSGDDDDYVLSYGIPNYVYRTYPDFWRVIGPHMPMFNKMILTDLKSLRFELSFLMNYPEVLSFNCKLLLFHRIQCIQQMKQQQQLQREYHNRGGILAFNSVIMTINNSGNNGNSSGSSTGGNATIRSNSSNSISFINGSSFANNSNSRSSTTTRRTISRTNNTLISFVNESIPPPSQQHMQSQPPLQPPHMIPSTNVRLSTRINSRTNVNNNGPIHRNGSNNNGAAENEDSQSNVGGINGGIIRPMIKVRRSHILPDTYSVFGPAFSELGFSIMPIRDIFVRFIGEPGIDLGGLTKDWISSTIKELFNQDYGLFKQTTDGFSVFPNPSSSVNPEHLGYFELSGRIIAISLAKDINIDAHLAHPFLKSILERKLSINDLSSIDNQVFNSLKWISTNDNVEKLDMSFVVDVERSLGVNETIDLIKNGRNIKVTDKNKNFFIASMANYYLHSSVEAQIEAFKKGFYSIISPQFIRMFTPTELDLLISGTNIIDVDDMRKNCSYEKPYNKNHPVIRLFFSCISKWDQDELHLLLRFITGLAHVPIGGFASMAEKKKPLTISPGGDRDRLPQAHTCFNRIDIPAYQSEKELNEKLYLAIHECDNFLLI